MATEYHSKHGIVGRSPMELYMAFTDLRNFAAMVPEDKKQQIALQADFDTLTATAQGMSISVKVTERVPYSRITLESCNSPLAFSLQLNFGDCGGGRTDFHINAGAELNGIMKMMIGGKIQKALDQVVDQLVNASAHI